MAKQALEEKRVVMNAVKAIPHAERTFENTVVALEQAMEQLIAIWGELEFLMNVKPKEVDRTAAKAAIDYIQAQAIELAYDEEIYQAYAAVAAKKPKLVAADKKLLTDSMREYRRMGFELPKLKRNAVKRKLLLLTAITSNFRKNINDYEDFILVSKEDLEGAPKNYIAGLPKQGGKYRVSLSYPDFIPFMENVHSESKRSELQRKFLRRGGQKNMIVLARMVKLRQEIAVMLGYKNHAEYQLEVKMAKRPATVMSFLMDLAKPLAKKVSADLTQLPQDKLQQHNMMYLINQDKKQRYDVDNELVREYFPLEHVTKGMFSIYEKLLGVKFKRTASVPTWHSDVDCYEVIDMQTKKLHAYFFLDLYPRAGKYGHAAVFPFIDGTELADGTYRLPVLSMVCNFPKPTKNSPSLLSHDEVETYFHEFGHVMQHNLARLKRGSQASLQVDFVEAPSQMLENWVWNASMLQLLSGHYKNPRKKLPKELLQKMLAAKYHMIGYTTMRQIIIGFFDMQLHTDPNVKNIAQLFSSLVKKYTGVELPKDQLWPASFGHLDGYDAGYYGYLWSQVYAADMFTRFHKEGLLNEKTGRDYRAEILEPGSSRDAMESLEKFLGRKPNNKAFLKELGL